MHRCLSEAICRLRISKIDGKEQKAIVEGVKRFQTAKTLNSFFIELIQDGVFTRKVDVTSILARLQDECVPHVSRPSSSDCFDRELMSLGLKKGQIIVLQERVPRKDSILASNRCKLISSEHFQL